MDARVRVRQLLDEVMVAIDVDVDGMKRRDLREPKRREKQELEYRLVEVIQRHWRKQRAKIRRHLEETFFYRKQLDPFFWKDEEDDLTGAVLSVLEEAIRKGVALFGEQTLVGLDYAAVNTVALANAHTYAYDLVQGITRTTRDALARSLEAFIATPGYTIGDVMTSLPYDEARAQMIATTEITRAYADAAQAGGEALRVEFPEVAVTKMWFTNNDDRVCPICGPMDGQEVDVEAEFKGGDGELYQFPPAHVNCLLGDTLVSAADRIAAVSEREYEGEVVAIYTAGHHELTCTPNHPILTRHGWMAAGLLQEGAQVLCGSIPERMALGDIHNQHVPTRIEEIAKAFRRSQHVFPAEVPVAAEDFHGDGAGSEVAVVWSDGLLRDRFNADLRQHPGELSLGRRHMGMPFLPRSSASGQLLFGDCAPTSGGMSRNYLPRSLSMRHSLPLHSLGLGLVAHGYTSLYEALADRPTIDANASGYGILGLASEVALDDVVRVERKPFRGHVYNLQTECGGYIANAIVTHNCRCWMDSGTDISA